MFKKLIAAALGLFVAVAFAASVDANKATQAELESIKGVGPGIATKIMDERKKGAFKDWDDLVTRVKGVGDGNAAKLSADGLTVNGSAFKPTATAPAMKKDDMKAEKAAAKADAKAKKDEAKAEKATKTSTAAAPATPAVPAAPATPAMPAKKTAEAAPTSAKPASATMTAAKPMAPAPKASEPAKK